MNILGYIPIFLEEIDTHYIIYSEKEIINYAIQDAQDKYSENLEDMPIINDLETARIYLEERDIIISTITQ